MAKCTDVATMLTHRAHTNMLLGVAMLLNQRKDTLKGTVRLLFHPTEEGRADASRMIKDGALGDSEAIFGMHVDFTTPIGSIGLLSGPLLAATSIFEAKTEGVGGHAAEPHSAVDPMLAASFAILALQQLTCREADPLHSFVCYLHQRWIVVQCDPIVLVADNHENHDFQLIVRELLA
ncbi:IAA-amino acid hydrolase ILR1-like 5 [Hibiscus syriacus]|uniref:IAA-amino acid hydrolase ILR1-like 5 n=1 Tax=Hibiscus syriacus TaxID=106335 RepID=A0A6A3CCV3_HIBSY|nr:IAA-amino acid hydrolase ILR1-like 5 [Hibiscus syriacus]